MTQGEVPASPLEGLVLALFSQLRSCGIAAAVGGALAYNYYGVPRQTGDIDINVFLPMEQGREALNCLGRLGIDFSDGQALSEIERDGQTRFLWRDVYIDLFFTYHDFHSTCQRRSLAVPFGSGEVSILKAEDLAVFKVIFNRTRDWADLERVIEVQGEGFDIAHTLYWLTGILGEDDSRVERLRQLYHAAVGHVPAPRPA